MSRRHPPRLLALPSYALSLTGRAARAAQADALAERGLRLDHVAALAALADFGPAPQRQLGDWLAKDAGDVARLLDELEREGLVARERDPADRRRQIATISAQGRRALAGALSAAARAERRSLAALDAQERAQLHALLLRALGER